MIFVFKLGSDGTKLLFTQMNCPIAKLIESDTQWDKVNYYYYYYYYYYFFDYYYY